MPEIQVGIQLASLKLPFKKALHTAARLGANAVEIDARAEVRPEELSRTAIRQIRKMLEDLNLRVCAVRFPTQHGYHFVRDLDRRIAATKRTMEMAYALGAGILVNQVGRVPDESSGPDWDMLVQSLTDIGRHGQKVGTFLAAETGSESGESMLRLIQALPDGTVGVTLDPGNLTVNNFSARDAALILGRHILYVHAKDGVRDLAQGRWIEVPLRRGAVHFPELLGILEEHQYRGYFTIERSTAEDPVYEIGAAVQYLRSL